MRATEDMLQETVSLLIYKALGEGIEVNRHYSPADYTHDLAQQVLLLTRAIFYGWKSVDIRLGA